MSLYFACSKLNVKRNFFVGSNHELNSKAEKYEKTFFVSFSLEINKANQKKRHLIHFTWAFVLFVRKVLRRFLDQDFEGYKNASLTAFEIHSK